MLYSCWFKTSQGTTIQTKTSITDKVCKASTLEGFPINSEHIFFRNDFMLVRFFCRQVHINILSWNKSKRVHMLCAGLCTLRCSFNLRVCFVCSCTKSQAVSCPQCHPYTPFFSHVHHLCFPLLQNHIIFPV